MIHSHVADVIFAGISIETAIPSDDHPLKSVFGLGTHTVKFIDDGGVSTVQSLWMKYLFLMVAFVFSCLAALLVVYVPISSKNKVLKKVPPTFSVADLN